MSITFKSSGGGSFSAVLHKLQNFEGRVGDELEEALDFEGLQMVTTSQDKFLSGPRPMKLDHVTGRLSDNVSHRVIRRKGSIALVIGTNVPYARRHELGFKGTEKVRAHTRVVARYGARGQNLGRRGTKDLTDLLFSPSGGVIGARRRTGRSLRNIAKDQRTGSVGVQFVKAHEREVNTRPRPFLRPAIGLNFKSLKKAIRTAIRKAH